MAFTIFIAGVDGAPQLYGTAGSLLDVLDWCLITGSGWIKPIPNTSSFLAQPNTMSYACYQQPTGSGRVLFLNDGGPQSQALFREAWATGWESIVSLSASVTNSVGYGVNPFPTSSQMTNMAPPFMHVNIRKSTTFSAVARPWVLAADSRSFYLFVKTGDQNSYFGFGFGDFYSFKSSSYDLYNCMIIGRSIENSNAIANEAFDLLSTMAAGTSGFFLDRSYNPSTLSVTASKHGDSTKGSATQMNGLLPYPNRADTSIYSSPIWVVESGAPQIYTIRGQLRGLYQPLHYSTSFADGNTYSGSSDYNAHNFYVVMPTPNNGAFLIETSDTLMTN